MSCAQCRGIEAVFGDRMAERELSRYRRRGPAAATRRLIDAVAAGGVHGRTFLDIGGGVGAVQHELMERGATGGTSVDASPAYLAAARGEAGTRGYADSVEYLAGDFVERAAEVGPADVVTLDRVVCCYPDMHALIGAAAPLARRAFGVVLPRRLWHIRVFVVFVNLVQRLRRHPFRAFVHDPDQVEAVLERNGLTRWYLRDGLLWRVMVFGRGRGSRSR